MVTFYKKGIFLPFGMSSFDSFLDDSIHSIIPGSIPIEVPISPKVEKLKRPPNAYNLFFMEQQAKVKLENPSLSGNQVSQELGRRWKEMNEESRKPYIDRANEIRDRFKQENPDYHYKNSKSPKKTTVFINRKDSFQVLNQLFQSSPFMFQQMLLEKDKKGNLDITKIFC